MSWARYDDALPHNRKVAWLRAHGANGIAALGLHLLLNTWSRHEGMQGFIPDYVPEQLAGRPWQKLVSLLADDGCGMLTAVDNGWMINDYDEYGDRDDGTPVDEKKARLSKVRAEAGRRGGIAKAAKQGGKATGKHGELLQPGEVANGATPSSNSRVSSPESSPAKGPDKGRGAQVIGAASGKPATLPASKRQQSSSPVPVPKSVNSPTSQGSPNAPAGFGPRIVKAYVEASRAASVPAPEESQARVERSARSLLAQGYEPDAIEDAARNAAIGGWTDLATQLQRDASRASPAAAARRESVTDQRVNGALEAGQAVAASLAELHTTAARKALT